MSINNFLKNQEQITGKWWIGSYKRRQYTGVINFDDRVRLKITGNIEYDPLQQEYPEIRGRLPNGDEFLLLDNFVVSSESSLIQTGKKVAKSLTFEPSKILFFPHIYENRWKSDEVDRLHIKIPYIDLWLGHQLFDQHIKEHQITYETYKEEKFRVHENEIIIGSHLEDIYRWSSNTRNQLSINQVGFVSIVFPSPVKLETAIEFYRKLEALFRLAYVNQFLIREFEGSIANEIAQKKLSRPRLEVKEIYYNHLLNKNITTPDYIDDLFLFTYTAIPDFQSILTKWYEIESKLAPVYQLLLTSLEDGVYLEQRFLSLVNALEIFHRRFRNRYRKKESEWEEQVGNILSAYKGADKKLLKRWLKYSNEITLEERIDDLVRGAANYGFAGMMPADIESIARTRNRFIHETANANQDMSKLVEATNALTELLLIAILQELDLDRETIHKITRKRYIFRYSQY